MKSEIAGSALQAADSVRVLQLLELMALHGLRTIEVHRASVKDLSERGSHRVLLVRDRLVYLRPDTAQRLEQYLQARGPVRPDELGTPLFAALDKFAGGVVSVAATSARRRTST